MQERKKAALGKGCLWVITIILLMVIAGGIFYNLYSHQANDGNLSISKNGEVIKIFSLAEIKSMPKVDVNKKIVSSSHQDEEGIFTGVPLEYLLNLADKKLLQESKQFITKAEDGYASSVSIDDVLQKNNILVVYAKDGQELGNLENGGAGPLRIVIVSDDYGNRSTKYLVEIVAK